jgi:hypothetical protein
MTLIAASLEPGNVRYRLNTVQVLEMMGRGDDAVRVAKTAASMAKTPEEQTEALAALANAQQFQDYQKKVKEQKEAFRKAQSEAVGASQPSQSEQPGPAIQAVSGSGQASTEPPKLAHRDEAVTGDKLRPSPAVPLSVHAPRSEVLASRKVAEGTIEDAKCSYPTTLEITLDSTAGVMQLYSDNYLKIPFSALNFTPKGILNPCADIKGWHARITYHPAKGQAKQGEMVVVDLTKN